MRAILQRVTYARVTVKNDIIGEIGPGWLVYIGIHKDDGPEDLRYIIDKTLHLRCFRDNQQKMNQSILDVGASLLVVSQFTLFGDCRKGRRPSFSSSAPPAMAESLYLDYIAGLRQHGLQVAQGQFQAEMQVESLNDGPVTMILDSSRIL